jgi:hypothetical protein
MVMNNPFNFQLSQHAIRRLQERQEIKLEWIKQVIENPELIQQDPLDPQLKQVYARITENNGRVLKVVYNATVTPYRIVTVHFDRTMEKKLC